MLQLSQYTTENFLPAVERLLADKGASLEVPAEDILALMSGEQVTNFVETKHPNEPLYLDYLASVIPLALSGGSTLSLAKAAFTYNRNRFKYDKKRRPIEQLVTAFTLVRPILTLTDKEKALTRAVAALVATGKYGSKEWYPFLARLTWGDGKCSLRPDPALQDHPRTKDAAQFLRELIRHAFPEPHAHCDEPVKAESCRSSLRNHRAQLKV